VTDTGGEDPPQPYVLRGSELIDEWKLTQAPDEFDRHRVLFFIRRLMTDPFSVQSISRVHPMGLPEHTTIVPHTRTQVTWIVLKSPPYDEDARCVQLVDIRPEPQS